VIRSRQRCSAALAGLLLALSLAAASSAASHPGGAPAAHELSASWFGAAGGPLFFASDELTSTVEVFSATTHAEVGLIAGTVPGGLAVDAAGNIYVADEGFISGGQRIVEFAPHARKPLRILSDQGFQPVELALAADGTVYVANDCAFAPSAGGCTGGAGNVVAYAPGATEPSQTLSVPRMPTPERIAVDAAGDVVVAGLTKPICSDCSPGKETAGEFAPSGKYTHIAIPHPVAPLRFDGTGRLAVLRGASSTLDLYQLPSPTPVGHIRLGAGAPDHIYDFAFSSDGSDVWAAKIVTSPGFEHEEAIEYSYTAGRESASFLIVGTLAFSAAVSPGLLP
jgi:hypothetical protein